MAYEIQAEKSEITSGLRRFGTPLPLIATIYIVVVAAIYPGDYLALLMPNIKQLEYFGIPFTLLALYLVSMVRSPKAPTAHLVEQLKERGLLILLAHVLFVLGLTAYTTFKVNFPAIVPFYADGFLSRMDQALHGGLPSDYFLTLPHEFGGVVTVVYTRVWPLVLVGLSYGVAVFGRGAVAQRYLWSLFFVYAIIGGVLATVFSSVGPIFYQDFYGEGPYDRLHAMVFSNPYLEPVQVYTRYLLANYNASELAFGTGISAMPSVHLATTVLFAWALTSFGRWYGLVGWLLVIAMEIGSIYTGWHYAIDGYVSFILVSAFWVGISRYYGLPIVGRSKSKAAPA